METEKEHREMLIMRRLSEEDRYRGANIRRLTGRINRCGRLARIRWKGRVDGVGDTDKSGRAIDRNIDTIRVDNAITRTNERRNDEEDWRSDITGGGDDCHEVIFKGGERKEAYIERS